MEIYSNLSLEVRTRRGAEDKALVVWRRAARSVDAPVTFDGGW